MLIEQGELIILIQKIWSYSSVFNVTTSMPKPNRQRSLFKPFFLALYNESSYKCHLEEYRHTR